MVNPVTHNLKKYFRGEINYTTCPGCGNGIVAQAILWAIDDSGIDFDNYAFVSGIGCSGWIPSPAFNTDVLHVTHGRAIAFATGLKLAAPNMKIIVTAGDGDTSAIGGNHFIHACRRNIDLTMICVNNQIYGMTGGQIAPTTPYLSKTTTTPYGSVERPFDLSKIAIAAGATFVARWTTFQARQLRKTIAKAILHPGFSFVEIISQCPVQYGKVLKKRNDAVAMLMDYKERSINLKKARELQKSELKDKIIVGEFVEERNVPELTQEINRLREEALQKCQR
ncbi:MAG: 2-oxoglutarate synthase [Candidatus Atribacteria bacterium]|jgi:2-oxoglutarate ferredoxin oxidoreductase subunit beta|nr:2-oxoglutarate synthase [Candidatus Atribacteria bacterium]